jgi:Rod binding domain-containing protein
MQFPSPIVETGPRARPASPSGGDGDGRIAELRRTARDLEAAFIAEMLKHAGMGEARTGLGGGGPGEDQFASLLRAEHARLFAERGGIGLAEGIFRSLAAREGQVGAGPRNAP